MLILKNQKKTIKQQKNETWREKEESDIPVSSVKSTITWFSNNLVFILKC